MTDQPIPLNWSEFDELSIAWAAGVATVSAQFETCLLGPFLEALWLGETGRKVVEPALTAAFQRFLSELMSKRHLWIASTPPWSGFIKVRREHTEVQNTAWTQFRLAYQRAATISGVGSDVAKQFTGAMGELEDNIHSHSEAIGTGLVAYWSHEKFFESVTMDQGIGVLASLKQSPDFYDLETHGEALALAIQDGYSRYGKSSGRGWGFHDLYVGMINHPTHLRFRSGDALLRLGADSRKKLHSTLHQRPHGKGTFVAFQCDAELPLMRFT